MTNPYFPLLIMAVATLVLAFGGLVASTILGSAKRSQTKTDSYECGIEPTSAHLHEDRFPIRHYFVTVTFIIFGIEVVFTYPWAVSLDQLGLFGLIAMLTFIALITVPYAYGWRRDRLDYWGAGKNDQWVLKKACPSVLR